jgi:hypothetical protein
VPPLQVREKRADKLMQSLTFDTALTPMQKRAEQLKAELNQAAALKKELEELKAVSLISYAMDFTVMHSILGNPREGANSAQQESTHRRKSVERKEIRSQNHVTGKHRERIARQDRRIATNFCKQRTDLRTSCQEPSKQLANFGT